MNVISMLDDYAALCWEAKTLGNLEAYRRYTRRYPGLFEGMRKYLYMTDLDHLRAVVEHTDFAALLATAKANINSGYAGLIESVARRTAAQLGFMKRFTLFLGMNLGKTGGYFGPTEGSAPSVYVGLDVKLSEPYIHTLIPHEMNHMVRCAALPGLEMFDFMERTISEGLATMCPIVLNQKEMSPDTYAEVLGLPLDSTLKLIGNARSLVNRVTRKFGKPLTAAGMAEYFTWPARGDRPTMCGYYVGMVIVKELLDRGAPFSRLTVTPSGEIWRAYGTKPA